MISFHLVRSASVEDNGYLSIIISARIPLEIERYIVLRAKFVHCEGVEKQNAGIISVFCISYSRFGSKVNTYGPAPLAFALKYRSGAKANTCPPSDVGCTCVRHCQSKPHTCSGSQSPIGGHPG